MLLCLLVLGKPHGGGGGEAKEAGQPIPPLLQLIAQGDTSVGRHTVWEVTGRTPHGQICRAAKLCEPDTSRSVKRVDPWLFSRHTGSSSHRYLTIVSMSSVAS